MTLINDISEAGVLVQQILLEYTCVAHEKDGWLRETNKTYIN